MYESRKLFSSNNINRVSTIGLNWIAQTISYDYFAYLLLNRLFSCVFFNLFLTCIHHIITMYFVIFHGFLQSILFEKIFSKYLPCRQISPQSLAIVQWIFSPNPSSTHINLSYNILYNFSYGYTTQTVVTVTTLLNQSQLLIQEIKQCCHHITLRWSADNNMSLIILYLKWWIARQF